MYYSKNGQYPTNHLPFRITLSNGMTRTDSSTFTEAEIIDAGYTIVSDPPASVLDSQILEWSGTDWNVRDKTAQELSDETDRLWYEIRAQRDHLLALLDWRFLRYDSQTRLGVTPIDNIEALDTYAQALRDITLQSDPRNIIWPSETV